MSSQEHYGTDTPTGCLTASLDPNTWGEPPGGAVTETRKIVEVLEKEAPEEGAALEVDERIRVLQEALRASREECYELRHRCGDLHVTLTPPIERSKKSMNISASDVQAERSICAFDLGPPIDNVLTDSSLDPNTWADLSTVGFHGECNRDVASDILQRWPGGLMNTSISENAAGLGDSVPSHAQVRALAPEVHHCLSNLQDLLIAAGEDDSLSTGASLSDVRERLTTARVHVSRLQALFRERTFTLPSRSAALYAGARVASSSIHVNGVHSGPSDGDMPEAELENPGDRQPMGGDAKPNNRKLVEAEESQASQDLRLVGTVAANVQPPAPSMQLGFVREVVWAGRNASAPQCSLLESTPMPATIDGIEPFAPPVQIDSVRECAVWGGQRATAPQRSPPWPTPTHSVIDGPLVAQRTPMLPAPTSHAISAHAARAPMYMAPRTHQHVAPQPTLSLSMSTPGVTVGPTPQTRTPPVTSRSLSSPRMLGALGPLLIPIPGAEGSSPGAPVSPRPISRTLRGRSARDCGFASPLSVSLAAESLRQSAAASAREPSALLAERCCSMPPRQRRAHTVARSRSVDFPIDAAHTLSASVVPMHGGRIRRHYSQRWVLDYEEVVYN